MYFYYFENYFSTVKYYLVDKKRRSSGEISLIINKNMRGRLSMKTGITEKMKELWKIIGYDNHD